MNRPVSRAMRATTRVPDPPVAPITTGPEALESLAAMRFDHRRRPARPLYDEQPGAHSSVDRALASGARGRRFESCCARPVSGRPPRSGRPLEDRLADGELDVCELILEPEHFGAAGKA